MESDSEVSAEELVGNLKAPSRQRKRSVRLTNPSDIVPIDIECHQDAGTIHGDGHATGNNETPSDHRDVNDTPTEDITTGNETITINIEEESDHEVENTEADQSRSSKADSTTRSENGVVYDETKPKRLPNPKSLKLGIGPDSGSSTKGKAPSPRSTLHESIGLLISPDDSDCPTKRRRRLPMHSQSSTELHIGDTAKAQPGQEDTSVAVPNIEHGEHYQPSPKVGRRKISNKMESLTVDRDQAPRCSSPVERLINKNGQFAVTSKAVRKHSSDARLGGNRERLKLPPQRKISLEARIEAHRYNEESEDIEQLRRRKVSFDTSALINGRRFMPLNDEIAVSDSQTVRDDRVTEEQDHEERYDQDHVEDSGTISIDNNVDGGESSLEAEHGANNRGYQGAEYFDNQGYVCDGDDVFVKADDHAIQNGYDETKLQYAPATIDHTTLPPDDEYNFSPSYTNGKVKRISTASEDTPPKSILKVRKEDTESMISDDSMLSGRSFKVRKDSIALFTGSDGAMQLQVLRKQHSKSWRSFGKKDIKQMWTNRHENIQKYKLHLFVLVLFTMTLAFVVAGLHFHKKHYERMEIAKRIFLDAESRELLLRDIGDRDKFTATLGQGIPLWQKPVHCFANYKDIHDKTCLEWRNYAKLDIDFSTVGNTSCYTIKWTLEPGVVPFDCFSLSNSYWYGPSNYSTSEWPVKGSKFEFSDIRSNFYGSGTFSHAFEYYWLSSSGSLIYVESQGPLEINWNDKWHGYVCFTGQIPSVSRKVAMENDVTYTMCNGVNIRDTHETIGKMHLPRPTSLPQKYLLESPHWSTVWDSSQFTVNESIVTNLANNIVKHGLNCSAIEIDGKWEDHYGDLMFNREAFPNITNVFQQITDANCQASLNIYPYVSFQSDSFMNGNLTYDYFVKDNSKTVPALVNWQHELGAMIDVSNPKAKGWYAGKLQNLSNLYDLKTFRLSYGISDWFPFSPTFNTSDVTPNKLKFMFSELLTTVGETIVQSTSNSQNITTLIGISSDIVSDQDTGVSCLSNVVPDVLNLGIAGYPFVMADGFAIEKKMTESSFKLPARSLFIRWMQLSSFFPAMRYTIKPWSYDNEVVEISKSVARFHKNFIVKAFYEFEENMLRGEPFIQPLWWIDPHDPETFTINDQFIVAGRYLVAPIFCESTREDDTHSYRDIYVPRGLWMDNSNSGVARGPMWIRQYKVAKNAIPYFAKMIEIQN